jgi:hypothetical protein
MKKYIALAALMFVFTLAACAGDNITNPQNGNGTDEAPSQKKLWLMEEMNVADWYESVFGVELPPEDAEQARILDSFYDFFFDGLTLSNGITRDNILLREYNICVAATEKFGSNYYSVIPVLKEGASLSLVAHTDPGNQDLEITAIKGGNFTMSNGLYPNIKRSSDGDIFWGESRPDRLGIDPNTGGFDIRVPNDFTAIEFTMESGNVKTIEITTPCIVLLFFEGERIVSIKMLNDGGEIHPSFNFTFDADGEIVL